MEQYGCYIIKEEFFHKFNYIDLKGNKDEHRPHYCCFSDPNNDKLLWVIPMSHKIEKFEKLIASRTQENRPCDIVEIIKINNNKSAMLMQDMFPITEKYIARPYTINNIPLVIKNEQQISIINKKAKNILRLINRHVKVNPTQPDVLKIKEVLLEELENELIFM